MEKYNKLLRNITELIETLVQENAAKQMASQEN